MHELTESKPDEHLSRREAVKRLACVAPVVLTLSATPSSGSSGSQEGEKEEEPKERERGAG